MITEELLKKSKLQLLCLCSITLQLEIGSRKCLIQCIRPVKLLFKLFLLFLSTVICTAVAKRRAKEVVYITQHGMDILAFSNKCSRKSSLSMKIIADQAMRQYRIAIGSFFADSVHNVWIK